MAASSYQAALARLLQDEGGYVNHPSDPGGPTNFGITLAEARRRWNAGATAADLRAMPESVARAIYREHYWDALRCDELAAGVDYAVFDYGVNSGTVRAGKALRRVLELPDRSGAVTDGVIAAVADADADRLVNAICAERLAFLRALKTFAVFGRGWTARVERVRAAALALAARRAPPASGARSAGSAGRASAGAVIVAGAATAVATARWDIVAAVVGAGAAAALAIILIRRWRDRAGPDAALPFDPNRTKGTSNGVG